METQVLLVSNLPNTIEPSHLFTLFNRHGNVIQVRWGCTLSTHSTALIVFDRIESAIDAYKHLNGYLIYDRSIHIEYFQIIEEFKKKEEKKRKQKIENLKKKIGEL
ncbi:Splicing factor 3B subunit 6-like protein [Astathelohania contejeani]|uniref:Splicing factor 3B subunit 6-like protein n=1 Tax=Astathelohania contejeani TaxID=164912 RepID=A0ABQ7I1J3_9MICR|nr:Splicing factor 3B subunit 6-like protein [Thelohania contejeani]